MATKSATEKLARAFVGYDVDLHRLQAAQRRKILKDLASLEAKITEKLQQQAGSGTFTEARQQALLRQVRQVVETGYTEIAAGHAQELASMIQFDALHFREVVNTSVGFSAMSVGVPQSVLTSLLKDDTVIGTPLRALWQQEAQSLQQAFIAQMRQGILAGETTDQLIQRVRGTKALNYQDGIMAVRRRGAELRVRTSAQSVLNDARLALYKKNDDVLKGWQVLAVLDDRTSDICMARSGAAWDLEGNPLEGTDTEEEFPGPPPWHPNCRSTLIPIVKSIGEILGDEELDEKVREEVEQLPDATQASMDGQVSGRFSYEEWLSEQSEERQRDILGAGKYALWKADKISLRDLIDQRGNPLTVEELKKRYG